MTLFYYIHSHFVKCIFVLQIPTDFSPALSAIYSWMHSEGKVRYCICSHLSHMHLFQNVPVKSKKCQILCCNSTSNLKHSRISVITVESLSSLSSSVRHSSKFGFRPCKSNVLLSITFQCIFLFCSLCTLYFLHWNKLVLA